MLVLLLVSLLSTARMLAQQVPDPNERQERRVDLTILAGFVTEQDARILLVEAPWTLNRYISVAPAYANIGSPVATTHQVRGSATFRLPLGKFVLDDRNLFIQGFTAAGNTTLYRNRLRLAHPFPFFRKSMTLFGADELFYDWRSDSWTRNWIYAGGSLELVRNITAQAYYLRQHQLGGAGINTIVYALLARIPGFSSLMKG